MSDAKQDFLDLLENNLCKNTSMKKIVKDLKNERKSPLVYAIDNLSKTITEGNGIKHSFRVFGFCLDILRNIEKEVSDKDKLLLFYASLMHDISKTTNPKTKDEIYRVLKKKCGLYCCENVDHGIRSAYYMDYKNKIKDMEIFGLLDDDYFTLLNIVSFHDKGRLKSFFNKRKSPTAHQLMLCLIFWVADKSDGMDERSDVTKYTAKSIQGGKEKARHNVKEIIIQRDAIIWIAREDTKSLKKAVMLLNKEISFNRLLLQAYGLPSRVEYVLSRRVVPKYDAFLEKSDLEFNDIYNDSFDRQRPLVMSAETLPELYEMVVESFFSINVSEGKKTSHNNYFGPLMLEVRNAASDEKEKVIIRNKLINDIETIQEYTKAWMSVKDKAEEKFYFGYTHGQRIFKYLYPRDGADRDPTGNFQDWAGKLNQMKKQVLNVLIKDGQDARQAHAIVSHPIIDCDTEYFEHEHKLPTSLIAVHFRIEKGNKLSCFAMLRAQELSSFFLVNYFEMKYLLDYILKDNDFKKKYSKVKQGRIVMTSTIGYFDVNSVLLLKPRICVKNFSEIKEYVEGLYDNRQRNEFVEMLEELMNKDFKRIETTWCDHFIRALKGDNNCGIIKKEIVALKKDLEQINDVLKGEKTTTHKDIREQKKKVVGNFIKKLNNIYKE